MIIKPEQSERLGILMFLSKNSLFVLGLILVLAAALVVIFLPDPVKIKAAAAPELPRSFLDTTYPTLSSSRTIRSVKSSCSGISNCYTSLQTAINQANMGDEIVIDAGLTITGPIILKNKTTGSGWIVIRTSNMSGIPQAGNRVGPANAAAMPKIESPGGNQVAIGTENNAHNYRLVGIEVREKAPASNDANVLVELGPIYSLCGPGLYTVCTDQSYLDLYPSNIVLDRMYIHGTPNVEIKRGVGLHSKSSAVIDSYISDINYKNSDSQAIAGLYGPGPYKIVNNFLEASGENVIFGGDDPRLENLVPSDIEIRGNYFFKPLSWKPGDSAYEGIDYFVKNLFELKNAQRVLVDGNIFENNWPQAQSGYGILFTVRNQSGGCPWCTVQDVTFQNNIVKNSTSGFNTNGVTDNDDPSGPVQRIKLFNNIWTGITYRFGIFVGGPDGGPNDFQIIHNTIINSGNGILYATGYSSTTGYGVKTGFDYSNNIAFYGKYGILGENSALGGGTLSSYFPQVVFAKNALIGGQASLYSSYNNPANYFPSDPNNIFVNYAGGDYHVKSGTIYKNAATDGKDLGADIDAVLSATANVIPGGGGGGGTITPTDKTKPVISTFDVQPRSGPAPVTATFTASDAGGSHLASAELLRAVANPTTCLVGNISGCSWLHLKSINAPVNADSWNGSFTDNPTSGSYLYGIHVHDTAGNIGYEPAIIPVSISSISPIVGDLNLDHIVNSVDFSILNSKWFTNDSQSDLNHDGLVNAIDYSMLNNNWFKTW